MTRSIWKGPHISISVLKRNYGYLKLQDSEVKKHTQVKSLRTYKRSSTLCPVLKRQYFHNGMKFQKFNFAKHHFGCKVGEFLLTRKLAVFNKRKKNKKKK